jgi:hypothetical protein
MTPVFCAPGVDGTVNSSMRCLPARKGAAVALVVGFLDGMGPQSAPALIALLDQHDWGRIDHNVRYVLLHEINTKITALRERSGLPPIDDALPHERDTGFLIIRKLLGAHQGNAHRSGSGK